MNKTCYVNGCTHPVIANSWRCRHHRHRGRCIVENCTNQVYARNLCCRHGAKKQCEFEGCNLRARLGNVCYKHGAHKKQCTEPECSQPAQARQKCVKHGGGRKCKSEGCSAHARTGGYCQRHRVSPTVSPKKEEQINMKSLWADAQHINHSLPRYTSMVSDDDISEVDLPVKLEPSLICMIDGIDLKHQTAPWDALHIEDKIMMRDILNILEDL